MKTILFVDDDPIIVQVYRGALKNAGYLVEVAADGVAAMEILPQLCPDLVLLDILMPNIDGQYVLEFIHSRPELKAAKVIIFSDAALSEVAKSTLAQYPNVYPKSGMTPKKLVQAVNELLDGGASTL